MIQKEFHFWASPVYDEHFVTMPRQYWLALDIIVWTWRYIPKIDIFDRDALQGAQQHLIATVCLIEERDGVDCGSRHEQDLGQDACR